MTPQTLPAALTIRALGADESEITITTPSRDLMADTIDPLGMDVSRYLAGTRAVNFAHDHGRLPVGKTLSLSQTSHGIRARFRWLESNPEARVVRDVFAEGVLGASVEFVPVEREANRSGGVHFAKSILTGWALTANPANPDCVRMMKSLGLAHDDAPVLVRVEDDDPVVLRIVDDAEDRVTFEEADLRAAVQTVIGERVQAAVRRQTRGLLGGAPATPVLRVADAHGDVHEIDADRLRDAIGTALSRTVGQKVHAALCELTGRLD